MDVALGSLEKPELPLGDCSLIGIQENVLGRPSIRKSVVKFGSPVRISMI